MMIVVEVVIEGDIRGDDRSILIELCTVCQYRYATVQYGK